MSRNFSLSRNASAAFISAALVIGSAAPVLALDHNSAPIALPANARTNVAPEQKLGSVNVQHQSGSDLARQLPIQKPWPAPVGHRQPRASDIGTNTQLSSYEVEQQRLDRELKAKLIICRGC